LEGRVIGFKYSDTVMGAVARDRALRHLHEQIRDPGLRAQLTPDYQIGCKRIILSNDLYPAMAAENTTLHDRQEAIEHLDATGIATTSGRHVDLDIIVWSTGFDATDGLIAYPVVGREGRTLAKTWDPFPRAYLGTTVPWFPNLFLITGPNTGTGHTSAVYMIESQLAYVTRAIEAVATAGATSIEVTPAAEGDYTRTIHRELQRTVWVRGGCHAWYQSESGHVVAMYPGFSFSFRLAAKRFRPEHHVLH
jgi:cation diffusion facilitator CzcD-associated flavoprotein CzcO